MKNLVYKVGYVQGYGNKSVKNEYILSMIQKWFDRFRYRDIVDDYYDTPV